MYVHTHTHTRTRLQLFVVIILILYLLFFPSVFRQGAILSFAVTYFLRTILKLPYVYISVLGRAPRQTLDNLGEAVGKTTTSPFLCFVVIISVFVCTVVSLFLFFLVGILCYN